MLRRPEPGKRATPPPPPPVDSGNGTRLLHDIEALSKALSIAKKAPASRPLPAPDLRRPRSVSAGKSELSESRSKPRSTPAKDPPAPPASKEKKQPRHSSSSSSSSSSSIWNWKPLKALSHIRHRRFDCRFTLNVHAIEGLPPTFNDLSLCVYWKRTGTNADSAGARTRAARVFQGVAEFEEVMAHRCSVYGTRSGHQNSAKYESRQFVLQAVVVGSPEVDLGKHRVDLTRVLPVTLEELEEENSSGEWSTTLKLTGKGRGALLNVSFGYQVVKDGLAEPKNRSSEGSVSKADRDGKSRFDRQGSLRNVGGLQGPDYAARDQIQRISRQVEDVKVLHEILPTSRSGVADQALFHVKKANDVGMDISDDRLKPQFEVFTMQDDEPLDVKASVATEPVETLKQREDVIAEVSKPEEEKKCDELESVKGDEEKDFDGLEFIVIKQGTEVLVDNNIKSQMLKDIGLAKAEKGNQKDFEEEKNLPKVENKSAGDCKEKMADLEKEQVTEAQDNLEGDAPQDCEEDLVSAFQGLSLLEAVVHTPQAKVVSPESPRNYTELKSDYKMNRVSKSLSLDAVTESVASEFLSMLGIEHSPFGLSSESEPDSPRERLLKQFEKETLNMSPKECLWREFEKESGDIDDIFGPDMGNGVDLDWKEDLDLNSIIHAAETEHQKATQAMKSKVRAKILEDVETETLMREWGLNEEAFHNSPPDSRSGFGSPIDLPPEEPLELPPLGEGLGPFIQTKDGGFLRSMSPSLFSNAKNNASLVMQTSSPVVVPAEMGSGVMDILQSLASIGIEKLSMQASKLMPLEDVTGKTMQQVAWEAMPALEASESNSSFLHLKSEWNSELSGNAFSGRKKGKSRSSSRPLKTSSEYVSLEDLAPLAMEKVEALSIEGLRIQSGMSNGDAPPNINPQSTGDMSACHVKGSQKGPSLELDGAAGLQLVDVRDTNGDIDGLMGLSLTLDEWMKLDSGIVDEDDLNNDRTSKILAAHHASSADLVGGRWKEDKRGVKSSGRRCGLLGNNFTVALMVQLRDPMRNYEPVGTPMLALIQVERVFVPPKPKIYCTVSDGGNSVHYEEDDGEPVIKPFIVKDDVKEEETVPQFKITEVHVAGLKSDPGKKKLWGSSAQQQSGSRWLLASGMGKGNKHPFMKSKQASKAPQSTSAAQPSEKLWSISSRVHGTGSKWKELPALNSHTRNPNVILK